VTAALLKIENLVVTYPAPRNSGKQAVSNVSLTIDKGESLGLVGESGCGKSSLAKAAMGFVKPAGGRIIFDNEDLAKLSNDRLRQLRPKLQMVFQDSISSLNPKRTIGAAIAMPLKVSGSCRRSDRIARTRTMMEQVGLDPSWFDRLPHQLSGGQCQRVQIARALITEPKLLICDEPVSSLDVSVQAQIIGLLGELQQRTGLTMLFISHNLAVVKNTCDRIAVMYAGKLCELSSCRSLYRSPLHPYSKTLLDAIPTVGKFKNDRIFSTRAIEVDVSPDVQHGCRYRKRCHQSKPRCRDEEPLLKKQRVDDFVACHYPLSQPSIKIYQSI